MTRARTGVSISRKKTPKAVALSPCYCNFLAVQFGAVLFLSSCSEAPPPGHAAFRPRSLGGAPANSVGEDGFS